MNNPDVFIPEEEKYRNKHYIKKLTSYKYINGKLNMNGISIETLGNIEIIHGAVDLSCTNLQDLGNLEKVNGDLWLYGCKKLSSLGKLRRVGGKFRLDYSNIKNLGNLEYVDGTLDLQGVNITSLNHVFVNGIIILSSNHKIPKKELNFYEHQIVYDTPYLHWVNFSYNCEKIKTKDIII